MFSLIKAKEKKDSEEAAGTGGKRITAAELRLQKDMAELSLSDGCTMTLPDPNDLCKFVVSITPDEGLYKGAKYDLSFSVPANYPHSPPKVHCDTKIYHPNIDTEGNVCLNILRAEWKPVLGINHVIYGLMFLFTEPNPDDPLNS
eukprot:JP448011.1.p1 GENE.JP448011.1~~JP448011.1.p1  ORF type:complete len:160 (+),score=32.97 JP448011.1:46-480(+)